MHQTITRRNLLRSGSASAAWALSPGLARTSGSDPRFVFVILRGALDGMALAPPVGDRDYVSLRGDLALPASGDGAALKLDGFFALNPNMPKLKSFYDEGHALVLQAAATPYRDRSHFDGQDLLENGTPAPNGSRTGWLNRAAAIFPADSPARGQDLFAVGSTVPLIMRGPAPVLSWSPGALQSSRDETLRRLARLYGHVDQELLTALTAGEKLQTFMKGSEQNGATGAGAQRAFTSAAAAVGRVLAQPRGPRIAALAFDGWDTHANEGPASGRLATLLGALDEALVTLRTQLGPAWNETIVAVMTEFGRTAKENGATGTDHGTASAGLLVGGAVRGRRVVADWPGLSASALYEGRDLAPTLDLRAVLKGILIEHLELPERLVTRDVFIGSERVPPMLGLVA